MGSFRNLRAFLHIFNPTWNSPNRRPLPCVYSIPCRNCESRGIGVQIEHFIFPFFGLHCASPTWPRLNRRHRLSRPETPVGIDRRATTPVAANEFSDEYHGHSSDNATILFIISLIRHDSVFWPHLDPNLTSALSSARVQGLYLFRFPQPWV